MTENDLRLFGTIGSNNLIRDKEIFAYVQGQTGEFCQVTDTCSYFTTLRQAIADTAHLVNNTEGAKAHLKHATFIPNIPEAIIPRLAIPDWLMQVTDLYLEGNPSAYELKAVLLPLGLEKDEADLATSLLSPYHTRAYLAVYRGKDDKVYAFIEDSRIVRSNPIVFYGYKDFPKSLVTREDGADRHLLIPQTHRLFNTSRRLARIADRHFELDSALPRNPVLRIEDFEHSFFVQALMGGEKSSLMYRDNFLAPRMKALGLDSLDFRLAKVISDLEIPNGQAIFLPLQLTGTHVDVAYLYEKGHSRSLVSGRTIDSVKIYQSISKSTKGRISPEARKKARAKRKKKKR